MKKTFILLILIVFAVSMLFLGVSCKEEAVEEAAVEEEVAPAEEVEEEAPAEEEYTFVFVYPALSEFYTIVVAGHEARAEEYGNINIEWRAPSVPDRLEEMIEIQEDYFARGDISACGTVTWIDATTLIELFTEAKDSNVYMFWVNTHKDFVKDLDESLWVSLIGYDNYKAGKVGAEWALENVGEGEVAIVCGDPSVYTTERVGGFVDTVEGTGLEVVAEVSGHWLREDGMLAAESMIQANPDIVLIYAIMDDMALGALSAVKAAGLEDQIKVIGLDGTRGAVESVRDGGLAGTVNVVPYIQGYTAVGVMYEYVVEGKDVDRYVLVEPHVTDATNVEEDLEYFPE